MVKSKSLKLGYIFNLQCNWAPWNNFHVKRMALSISLFSHGNNDRHSEVPFSFGWEWVQVKTDYL